MKIEQIKFLIDTEDMDRIIDFYTQTFGFQTKIQSPFWSEITFGEVTIGIHGGGDTSTKISSLSIQVDDIEEACAMISQNGGKIITKPEQREGEPIMLGTFQDTEGNEIMLTKYVG